MLYTNPDSPTLGLAVDESSIKRITPYPVLPVFSGVTFDPVCTRLSKTEPDNAAKLISKLPGSSLSRKCYLFKFNT